MAMAESTLSETFLISSMKRGATTKTKPVGVLMRKFWPVLEYCPGASDTGWGGVVKK